MLITKKLIQKKDNSEKETLKRKNNSEKETSEKGQLGGTKTHLNKHSPEQKKY